MPDGTFQLDIVSPERLLESISDAVSLVVPAADGYLGIQAGHAPLIAQLVPGEIKLTRAGGLEDLFATSGGFLEVSPSAVTLLADTAERPGEIDRQRAQEAYERAAERLREPHDLDMDRARYALARALARLTVLNDASGR